MCWTYISSKCNQEPKFNMFKVAVYLKFTMQYLFGNLVRLFWTWLFLHGCMLDIYYHVYCDLLFAITVLSCTVPPRVSPVRPVLAVAASVPVCSMTPLVLITNAMLSDRHGYTGLPPSPYRASRLGRRRPRTIARRLLSIGSVHPRTSLRVLTPPQLTVYMRNMPRRY